MTEIQAEQVTRAAPDSLPEPALGHAARRKVIFVQTQAENAGAQEVARQLAHGAERGGWRARQVFFFRRTDAFDHEDNVFFCAHQRPATFLGLLGLLFRLHREFRREKPDAVVSFQHYGNIIAAPIARLAGARLFIANQVSTSEHTPGPARVIDYWLGRLGFYDSIIVNSAATEATYISYPASYARRIVRIDHGFHDKAIMMDKAAARSQLGLPSDAQLLGCAARLHPLKQLDLAIRILAENERQHFVIAGQGPDRPRLETMARELGVAERVHFAGELDAQAMGAFLAALDCFVFPSSTESFGLAPVEAAQAGVPVVVNDIPVLREVLATEGCPCALFVDASDIKAFAAAVRSVFEDKALADRLSAAGRRLKEKYPLDKMVEEYLKLMGSHAA
jgi:glycosyltransferase involved in cell wall biosynthesis